MPFVTFIIAIVFFLVAAILFVRGLIRLYENNESARGLISSGFIIGLVGVVICAVTFGFFSL